jgi:hypothetical protein
MRKISPARLLKFTAAVFCALLFVAGFAPNSSANQLNHETMVTFTSPVEVPGPHGTIVLSAGTYVLEATNPFQSHIVVQIFNRDKTRLYATVLAIRSYRQTLSGTEVTFAQSQGDPVQKLKTWFYRNYDYGQEFIYAPEHD